MAKRDPRNYQTISGVTLPMHIQRLQQGTLVVDLVISGAVFNTGLSLSTSRSVSEQGREENENMLLLNLTR